MYKLLPFRFSKFDSKYFLTNEIGEFIFLKQQEFNSLINKEINENSTLYKNLSSKFFICEPSNIEFATKLLSVKYRTKKSFLNNFTTLHIIVPTLQCNSNCLYCQVSSQDSTLSKFIMDLSSAKKVVNLIFKSSSKYIKIELQGGEPLLKFDLVQKIIKYSTKLNRFYHKHLEFVICTNLTLITERQLTFIKKFPIWISTSLDGPKEIHDYNRPLRNGKSSYDLFKHNLEMTRNIVGFNRISALLTVTKKSLSYHKEIINEYILNQFHSIFLRSLNPFGLAIKNKKKLGYSIDDFIEFYKKSLLYIIKINLNGYFLVEEYASIILNKILTPFSTSFVDLQSPAGIGISYALYNYDGNIYTSDEGRMLAETGDNKFHIGSISQKYEEIFYGYKIKSLIRNSVAETLPECCFCPLVVYCGADPVRNYVEQNDIIGNRIISKICKKNKEIINFLLKIIDDNNSEYMNVFWSWITHRQLNQVELKHENNIC